MISPCLHSHVTGHFYLSDLVTWPSKLATCLKEKSSESNMQPLFCEVPLLMKSVPDKCDRCRSVRAEWRRCREDLQPSSGSLRSLKKGREGTNRKAKVWLAPVCELLADSMRRKTESYPWWQTPRDKNPWSWSSHESLGPGAWWASSPASRRQRQSPASDQTSDSLKP